MLTWTVAVLVRPELSTAVPVTIWSAPSVGTVTGGVQLAMPDSPSEQVNVTVEAPGRHPAPFLAGVTKNEIVGAVRSTLIPVTTVVAELLAMSTATPVADWLAPSPRVTGAVQDFTVDSASAQVNVTVAARRHPLALAAGDTAYETVGATLSMLIAVAVTVATLP